MKKILIIGATSAIAKAVAEVLETKNIDFFLVARNEERLRIVEERLREKGARKVGSIVADLCDFDKHEEIFEKANLFLNGLDTVLISHGILGDSLLTKENTYESAEKVFKTNFLSVVSLMSILKKDYRDKEDIRIGVISSVAGDLIKKKNYIYSASKAALNGYLVRLQRSLNNTNISVTIIKPGSIKTPMMNHLKKNFLCVEPEAIALGIKKALECKKEEVYLPGYWYWIVLFFRIIPRMLTKRLNF